MNFFLTISDKDLLKKCHTCMEIIRVAKERQAAEAAKNASNLLEELDREKNLEPFWTLPGSFHGRAPPKGSRRFWQPRPLASLWPRE